MVLYYILTTFYVLVCLLLLLVILLQQGKGGDMASAFGGGSSQTAFGARGGATVLTKATTVLAVLFMLGALMLAIIGQRGPGSLVSGTPAPPAQKPVSAPAAPAGGTPAATRARSAGAHTRRTHATGKVTWSPTRLVVKCPARLPRSCGVSFRLTRVAMLVL